MGKETASTADLSQTRHNNIYLPENNRDRRESMGTVSVLGSMWGPCYQVERLYGVVDYYRKKDTSSSEMGSCSKRMMHSTCNHFPKPPNGGGGVSVYSAAEKLNKLYFRSSQGQD